MCGASGLIPVHALARVYHRRALETVEAIGAEGTLAYALTLQRISVYLCGIGDWTLSGRYLDETESLFEHYGHLADWGTALQMRCRNVAHLGRFEDLANLSARMAASSHRRRALVDETWSLNNRIS